VRSVVCTLEIFQDHLDMGMLGYSTNTYKEGMASWSLDQLRDRYLGYL
jgi:hypothetical protein